MLHDRQLTSYPARRARVQGRSGRRSDTLVIVLDPRTTRAAARARRFRLGFDLIRAHIRDRTESGRQEVGDSAGNFLLRCSRLDLLLLTRAALDARASRALLARSVIAGTLITRTIIPRTIVPRAILTIAITALEAFATRLALLPVRTLLARLIEAVLVALAVKGFVLALVLVILGRTLVLEPRASLAQHAEVMVSELQVIFGLDPVPRKLRVPRHVLVLFEQLRRIAAAALVAATAAPAAPTETSRLLTPATATAAALAIVHQA